MDNMSRDIMVGADVIAEFLGMRRRQVYRAAEYGYLPVFRVGALICARRTTLTKWIEQQEGASLDRTASGEA